MNNYPEYVEVNGKRYKIDTDFRTAIECNRIALDETIKDYERALGIVVTLFGSEPLKDENEADIEALLKLALKYLSCGREIETRDEEPDMDYVEDMDYIEASFQSDYGINLEDTKMHWWKFNNLINGLSNSEFGNCCILNRIRNLRTFDTSEIQDDKERDRIEKAKKRVALKKYARENNISKEQEESMDRLNKIIGL